MQDADVSLLHAWDSFYVILGSSSAALTGLVFIVVTLIPEPRRRAGASIDGLAVFTTPTIVHFCAVLLVSAILSAPWPAMWLASAAVGLSGLAGVVYGLIVIARMRRVPGYEPVREDWLWHALWPLVAYVALMIAGIMLGYRPAGALFGIAAASVALLFIGIHNAWDTITYLALEDPMRLAQVESQKPEARSDKPEAGSQRPETRGQKPEAKSKK